MAVDTVFSSLPFSPLPHLCEKSSRGGPSKGCRGLEGYGSTTQDKLCRERLICRGALSEDSKSTIVLEPVEPERKGDEGFLSWSQLASKLVPVVARNEASAGFPTDYADERTSWSPLQYFLSSDDGAGDGFLRNIHGFGASAAAVQSTPPPKQKREDPGKQDFHVNIGYAIRTLREELPSMFYKELTYDIYRKDIVFRDPMNVVGGMNNYKLIFRALRFHGRVFFKALWVDILRIWQPSDKVIMVRWQVRGIPRVPWEAQGIFDGTSEYKLDKHGKIYEHKVDNVALNTRPKFKVPTVAELLRVGTCPSPPKPTFFQKTGEALMVLLPYLLQFTWVRYYLALKGTLNLHQDPSVL